MKTYYLFLDEVTPNTNFNYFSLAGFIIESSNYQNKIIPLVNNIKNTIFGTDDIILHEIDIRKEEEPFTVMKNEQQRKQFWKMMSDLFVEPDLITTIGVAIDCTEYKRIYNTPYSSKEYNVALQVLMENFTHFLEKNNGKGSVFIESRNPTEDKRLQNHYHILLANGSLFFDKDVLQKRLGPISFPIKADNNIGLQIADFIPNPLARECGKRRQKNPNLFSEIKSKLYDGEVGLPNRFGLKVIP